MAKTVVTSERIRIRVKAYEPAILEQKFQDLFHFQQKKK